MMKMTCQGKACKTTTKANHANKLCSFSLCLRCCHDVVTALGDVVPCSVTAHKRGTVAAPGTSLVLMYSVHVVNLHHTSPQ